MAVSYSFGIEIEIIAKPLQAGSHSTREYYEKFAQALRNNGLRARADDLTRDARHNRAQYSQGWWITRDGSLGVEAGRVALEAVSPILKTSPSMAWRHEMEQFWLAQRAVFNEPDGDQACGSHIHISQGNGQGWSVAQLRNIALGIAYYEDRFHDLLPATRQENQYCQKNSASSSRLGAYRSGAGGWNALRSVIVNASKAEILSLMQTDRRVLWNFQNVVDVGMGTIEFRGGRHLRGPVRTKRWIAFTIAYIHLLVKEDMCTTGHFPPTHSALDLYKKIRGSAEKLHLVKNLPKDYRVLNESRATPHRDGALLQMPRWTYSRDNQYDTAPPPYASNEAPVYASQQAQYAMDPEAGQPSDEGCCCCSSSEGCCGPGCSRSIWFGVRALQLIFAITVAGLYGSVSDTSEAYAVVVASVSAVASVVSIILLLTGTTWAWGWICEGLLFFLWVVLSGIFGTDYGGETGRMGNAIAVDIINMLLWFATAVARGVTWWRKRRND